MARARRERLLYFVLTPAIVGAILVLGWLALRTTLQIEKARQQTVLDATLTLAAERVEVLDKFVIAQDNVVSAHVDLADLAAIGRRWKSTAVRETPTVRAILVLDMSSEAREVLAFHSLAPGPENDTFRRLLLRRLLPDMKLDGNVEELRHLHLVVDEQSYLLSYWQRRFEGRTYLVAVWHDVPRIVHETLPRLYREPDRGPSRMNVIDEQGRIVFGPPIQGGAFTVGLPFPTTLYNWRLQLALASADELADKVQRRQLIELSMVSVAGVVAVAGLIIVLVAAAKERRVSTLKSDFVANVSHELKTPLALVRMFGELLLLERVKSDEKRRQYLQIIVSESERLTALIDNVLDFAKVERGKAAYEFVPGDVGEVVARAVEVYRYRAEREEVAVGLDLEDDLPGARIDARALELAVINLLDNALKYAKEGGRIDVTVRAGARDVEVRVADRGPGIPVTEHERIFDRFVRGSAAQTHAVRGSGIGLALVKYIADAHGGRVLVESPTFDDGTGTTFSLVLPALPRPAWTRPGGRLRGSDPGSGREPGLPGPLRASPARAPDLAILRGDRAPPILRVFMPDRAAETRAVAARVAKTLRDRGRTDDAVAILAASAAALRSDPQGAELLAEVLRMAPTAPIAKQAFERMEGIAGDDHRELDAAIARWPLEALLELERSLRPAFRKAQLGFNNNVKHLGKVFHVQTEDSGLDKPHIVTHLFADGGRIIKSHKRSYASMVARPDVGDRVKILMKGQHMEMVLMLREGRFDGVIAGTSTGGGMETLTEPPRVALDKVGRAAEKRRASGQVAAVDGRATPPPPEGAPPVAAAPDPTQPHLFTLHVLRSLWGGPERYEPRGTEVILGRSGQVALAGERYCHPTEAVVFVDKGELYLEDIDGGNGVFVRIRTRVELADGDEFVVGDQLLRLQKNPEVDDGPGPGPTYFFSSPKPHASFRIAQIFEGGMEGTVCLARHNALQVGSVIDEHFFNDMILRGDPLVAPYHCVVEEQADSFILSDLGARSGVFVRVVGRYKLQHGDELLVGRTRLLADLSPMDRSLQPLG